MVRAARLARVEALVFTSSASVCSSPYRRSNQTELDAQSKVKDDFPFASAYARTKYRAEQLVCQMHTFEVHLVQLTAVYELKILPVEMILLI